MIPEFFSKNNILDDKSLELVFKKKFPKLYDNLNEPFVSIIKKKMVAIIVIKIHSKILLRDETL